MINTFLSSFLGVFISILASLSQIFHFGCHVRKARFKNNARLKRHQEIRMLSSYPSYDTALRYTFALMIQNINSFLVFI